MIESARRIASWSLHPIRLPYRRSVKWASLTASDATFMILRLTADDGTVGVAEMHVSPRWFGTTFRTMTAALEDLFFPMLKDVDPLDRSSFVKRAGTVPEHMCAKALVDNALWDLAAASGGEPFWKAAGEKSPGVSWILTRQAPAVMAEEAADMAARHGFHTFKLKGGQGLEVDVEAVRLLRAALGAGVTIYIDCNREYSADVAPEYLRVMAAEGVVAIEDPYALEPTSSFGRIQGDSPIPIILDIPCPTLREARLFCERGARAIALKSGRAGLSEAAAMAELARRHECAVFVGSAVEGHIGSLSALGAARRFTRPEGWMASESAFFLMFGDHVLADPLTVVDGRVTLPDVAGLAQLVDWDRVEHLRA
jgi:L-Ala-D/L-Glu epimerase